MAIVAVSLGSNLGDRRGHLLWAVGQLSGLIEDLRASTPIETDAADVPSPQPRYLNMVVVGRCGLTPRALMTELLELERKRGRVRVSPKAARTLDLDLILYGDRVLDEPGVLVPHPRFRSRRFVLEPLVEIAPDIVDPETGLTAAELLRTLVAHPNKTKGV
jgi:2-amino-4-hydroxy-6-hydroxymethyldihydropteridine diphosphokinase